MKIIVTIKQILDPAGITVNRRRERIFTENAGLIINPADRRALEAALRLKDAEGAEIVALSLGEPAAEDALREALALGADGACLIDTGGVCNTPLRDAAGAGNAPAPDAAGAALALARAVQQIGGYDLILAGQAAADSGGEQVAGRLAELLGLTQVMEALELDWGEAGLIATRRWNGERRRVSVPLPAVIAVSPDAPPARYAHGARILNAYRQWSVTTLTPADLGLGAEELAPAVESRGTKFPPPRELGSIVGGTPAEAAAEVAAQLRARRFA